MDISCITHSTRLTRDRSTVNFLRKDHCGRIFSHWFIQKELSHAVFYCFTHTLCVSRYYHHRVQAWCKVTSSVNHRARSSTYITHYGTYTPSILLHINLHLLYRNHILHRITSLRFNRHFIFLIVLLRSRAYTAFSLRRLKEPRYSISAVRVRVIGAVQDVIRWSVLSYRKCERSFAKRVSRQICLRRWISAVERKTLLHWDRQRRENVPPFPRNVLEQHSVLCFHMILFLTRFLLLLFSQRQWKTERDVYLGMWKAVVFFAMHCERY